MTEHYMITVWSKRITSDGKIKRITYSREEAEKTYKFKFKAYDDEDVFYCGGFVKNGESLWVLLDDLQKDYGVTRLETKEHHETEYNAHIG